MRWLRLCLVSVFVFFPMGLRASEDEQNTDISQEAADEAYDATKSSPIVDWIERNIKGGRETTMDEDYREAGGTTGPND